MNEMTHLTADERAMLAKASKATRGKWSWSTSNSWRRLTSEGGRDGGVLCPDVHPYDKHPDCSISDEDMAHIEAANPDAVLKLLADLNAARATLAKLPKTADGVEIVPGASVYTLTGELIIIAIVDMFEFDGPVYSTREAALAAKDAAEGRVG